MKRKIKSKISKHQMDTFEMEVEGSNVFYSFKYEYVEIVGEGSKFCELKTPKITVMVTVDNSKKFYFEFNIDLKSTTTFGKLHVVANVNKGYGPSLPAYSRETLDDSIKMNFSSLTESNIFTILLNTVHTECVRIASKFKDANTIAENDPKNFFN